jgi:hypothetical protein
MNIQLQERLDALRNEFRNGQQALAELDARRENLRATLLRISGAIQVLEEFSPAAADPNARQVHSQDVVDQPAHAHAYG